MTQVTAHVSAPTLIVVEGRAACASWLAHLGASPEEGWAVLEQEEWEPLSGFCARLGDTLSRATASSDGTLVVTLVTSQQWDVVALDSRRRLALEILAHLARGAGGALLLTHGHQRDLACRDALTTLAEELSPEWADARVTVSAHFEDRTRREPRKTSNPNVSVIGRTLSP